MGRVTEVIRPNGDWYLVNCRIRESELIHWTSLQKKGESKDEGIGMTRRIPVSAVQNKGKILDLIRAAKRIGHPDDNDPKMRKLIDYWVGLNADKPNKLIHARAYYANPSETNLDVVNIGKGSPDLVSFIDSNCLTAAGQE